MFRSLNRRQFFANALVVAPLPRLLGSLHAASPVVHDRQKTALELRTQAAVSQSRRSIASMIANGDEDSVPNRAACFAKGLPQNQFGEVQGPAYNALLAAMKSGSFADFEHLPRAGGRRLSNPQAAFAFHLEGGDPHTFDIPAAPSIKSKDALFETSEIYWQSLCRDVSFLDYETNPIIQRAAKNLGLNPHTVFRGPTKSDAAGPYISQFLLKPIPYGSGKIEQKYNVPVSGSDFMTTPSEWSQIQTGFSPWRIVTYDDTPRYIRNGRDLSEYVHYDFANQAHLGAALILINSNAKSVLNCNQFRSGNNPYRYSTVEEGFVTFGPAEAVDWLGRVTSAALKAASCHKWMVHRRLRPEALGGLIHQTRTGARKYPIHEALLHSDAVDAVYQRTGSYLLPQTYPEGCPIHPSYPSGHAAVAGACAVVLKACFDGSMLYPNCVEPSRDGAQLVPCSGYFPTVADEINKLAFNVAMGRDWAGIHYLSDTTVGLKMGEEVGISILQDLARTFSEDFRGFSFSRFDGSPVKITPRGDLLVA